MKIIGRREKVDFPNLDLKGLVAKIDTGAYTSSLHCCKIREITRKNGTKYLFFIPLDIQHSKYTGVKFRTDNYKQKLVKSSNGKSELRFVILTQIKIGEEIFNTEITLTNRKDMKYPVLIGRKFIKYKFMVDVSKVYYLTSGNNNS